MNTNKCPEPLTQSDCLVLMLLEFGQEWKQNHITCNPSMTPYDLGINLDYLAWLWGPSTIWSLITVFVPALPNSLCVQNASHPFLPLEIILVILSAWNTLFASFFKFYFIDCLFIGSQEHRAELIIFPSPCLVIGWPLSYCIIHLFFPLYT